MNKASDITKWIAAQNPKSLTATGRLIFRVPLEVVLLGVSLDRSAPLTRTNVGCVILPLCKPVEGIYFEVGTALGVFGLHRFYGGDLTKEEPLLELKDIVLENLLPQWDSLSDVERCIEYLLSVPFYKPKSDGFLLESLVCLSAYQRTYERCLEFIEGWRVYSRTESGLRLSDTSSFHSQRMVVETVEKYILCEDYQQLRGQLDKWYQKSLTKLGLTRYTKFKIDG